MSQEIKSAPIVLKFGGAAVATPAHFAEIARLILRVRARYPSVITVVSAMAEMTNHLCDLAYQVHPSPPKREYDMLVSIGERMSISLLAMALARIGVQAMSFTGSQSGIMTCGNHSEARIMDVRPSRIQTCLHQGRVAIVAGFQGVSQEKEITTLGRGGSDTTAVALAIALGAERVVYFKDVDGVYDADPKQSAAVRKFSNLDYPAALSLLEKDQKKVLHPRSIVLAQKNGIPMHVRSFKEEDPLQWETGTEIGPANSERNARQIYEE